MAEAFLEELLPIRIKMGAVYGDDYAVEITRTASGREFRHLIHPYPVRSYTISTIEYASDIWDKMLALYHRCYGMYAGFRVRTLDDFSTNNHIDAPTATDQPLLYVSPRVYQLQKFYGEGATPLPIGLPARMIYKPVAGSVKVKLGAFEMMTGWTVDTTTGLVTFDADRSRTITAITLGIDTVLTVGAHGFVIGEMLKITGVVGTTQLNNVIHTVTAIGATTVTIDTDSTTYSAYVSGGLIDTGWVTAISNATDAVITVGPHSYQAGELVYISGVVGMTEINGLRAAILSVAATTITVDLDTTTFTPYVSGGKLDTPPQQSETLTAGCLFDIPFRFNSKIDVEHLSRELRDIHDVEILELINL